MGHGDFPGDIRQVKGLRYGDICSGVSAASLAWKPLGFTPAWFAETDAQCSSVLAHHYPGVRNYGDFTRIPRNAAAIDILVGGTPCQSFSVAGRRGGMADPRGNLALEFVALARRTLPRWIVWENVPGVLSSAHGADFAAFVAQLADVGYLGAWRLLDALRVGGCELHRDEFTIGPVPQRRRRVFLVAYLGAWEPAAEVLFDAFSLRGNPAPGRKAKADAAGRVAGIAPLNCRPYGDQIAKESQLVTGTLDRQMARGVNQQMARNGLLVAGAMGRHYGQRNQPAPDEMHNLVVAHSLRGEGFDASEDGSQRGTPLVYACQGTNVGPFGTLHGENETSGVPFVAYRTFGDGGTYAQGDRTGAIGTNTDLSSHLITFEPRYARNGRGAPSVDAAPLKAQNGTTGIGDGAPCVSDGRHVRRLTPRECERLMGFPDDYTLVRHKGKLLEDGPRYRMIGNSIAIPPLRWIGARIAAVDRKLEGAFNEANRN